MFFLPGCIYYIFKQKIALVCIAVYCTDLEGARSDQKNKNITWCEHTQFIIERRRSISIIVKELKK